MKKIALAIAFLLAATPCHAQLGSLRKKVDQAQKVANKAKKLSDLSISEKEERAIGEAISEKLRTAFGVYQDPAVTKYLSLVGTVLAQSSSRPALNWQFIVLDTDGVNAYAAPGGLVHVTRGLLGLVKNEAELAGALSHEISHITEKHTINAIQKSSTIELASDEVSDTGLTGAAIAKIGEAGYQKVFENQFDRGDEMEADKVGVRVVNKVGYNPAGLSSVLQRLADRNKDQKEPNGLFASHPQLSDRIAAIGKLIKDDKLTSSATVAARYGKTITLTVPPVTEIAMIDRGARGLAGSSGKAEPKKEEPKKSGLGLGGLTLTKGSQSQNSQNVASAGARGIRPDRDAKGGDNPRIVRVALSAAEIDAFKKAIA
ncbi:MAG: M48 family metalloprotease [Vicinamibacterales bacterium]